MSASRVPLRTWSSPARMSAGSWRSTLTFSVPAAAVSGWANTCAWPAKPTFTVVVEQRRHVAPELAHRSGRERGLQHGLVIGRTIQLDQPARAVVPHHLHAAERVGPPRARRRSIDPEPVRTARTQLLYGPARDQVPALDDPDPVADALDKLELVAGEDDRHAGRRALVQDLAHRIHRFRVEAGERLVQHEHHWFEHKGRGQLHALLVAVAQTLDLVFGAILQSEPVEPVRRGRGCGVGSRAVQLREVRQLFARAHLRIESALLRHVADAPPGLEVDRRAVPQHLAAVGDENAQDDSHRGGLARAVAADETEHLARTNVEAEAVHRQQRAVALGDALEPKA